jgi:hypothetical protein
MSLDRIPDLFREAFTELNAAAPRRRGHEAREQLLAAAREPEKADRYWPLALLGGALVALVVLLMARPGGPPPSSLVAGPPAPPTTASTQFVHVLSTGTIVVFVPPTHSLEVLR